MGLRVSTLQAVEFVTQVTQGVLRLKLQTRLSESTGATGLYPST